jgi:large subunit ribosomal protein L5
MATLYETYKTSVRDDVSKELAITNHLASPRLTKVIVNVGTGEMKGNEPLQKSIEEGLRLITGQKPVPTRAKRAIAGFKLRANDHIGYRVTLRGQRMYDFLDRLITYVFPRIRDFQGFDPKGFDGRGAYSFGLREQSVFPEIPFDSQNRAWGMQISIVTTGTSKDQTRALLTHLGFPFSKQNS